MKLAISNIAWDASDDHYVADLMGSHQVYGLEIAPTKYWPAPCNPSSNALRACADFWRARGIRIVSMQALLYGMTHFNLFAPASEQDAMLTYLTRIIDIGAGLGARCLVFGSPRNRDRAGLSDSEALAMAVDFFGSLADCAHARGLTIGLEPNASVYNCNFATTAAEALQVVEAVDHPGLALHLDAGVMHLNGENPADTIATTAHRLCHVHASEPQLAPLGTGCVAHAELAAQLRHMAYSGYIAIEMRAAGDTEKNRRHLAQALRVASEAYA